MLNCSEKTGDFQKSGNLSEPEREHISSFGSLKHLLQVTRNTAALAKQTCLQTFTGQTYEGNFSVRVTLPK